MNRLLIKQKRSMKKSIVVLLSLLFVNLGFSTKNMILEEAPLQYNVVEIKPLFPGGLGEFMMFVMKNYNAPESEEGESETGTVQVSIVIDKEGNVSNVKILKDVGNAGAEIKRVLAKCPKWQAGRNKGQNVAVEYSFPITIK
jgi:TonB family protein